MARDSKPPFDSREKRGAYHPFDQGAALEFALAVARWAADCECRIAMEGNRDDQNQSGA
jgi:hypothetical protein